MTSRIRIGALISGGGSNLQAIIDACENGYIPGRVVCIGSDKSDAGGLERARAHHIPSFVINYPRTCSDTTPLPISEDAFADILLKQSLLSSEIPLQKRTDFFKQRIMAEKVLLATLDHHNIDLLVLAGYMRLLSPFIIDQLNITGNLPRIMNIHPAILPAFPGTDGYADTYHYGCKVGGCTVHFVDYGEDSGPIIGQKTFPITPKDTLESVKQKGLSLEWELYPECIRLYALGRLKLVPGKPDPDYSGKVSRWVVKHLPVSIG
ncbi:MAG: phosphoribosylglycinamide formyltransferase [Deltaproteobacteria bacterium]|nr:MAG: phosphoribosylglycinamide formyltransferase [Deltaproteobacteria bacterium]